MTQRPRLTPAVADVRRAVRTNLADVEHGSVVLVALSGGPDSLALAAGLGFEAPKLGLRAGAIIVDHGLQDGSAEVAERAASQAQALGLDPVIIRSVKVVPQSGPEADARTARYAALEAVAKETGAVAVLLGHTLDDQAETVLLGLTRGSGATSLAGMSEINAIYRRPLLGIRRAETVAACADQQLTPWNDPHNEDSAYTRVRIRTEIMPMLEDKLGPGVAEALARTAEQLRQDAVVLDALTAEMMPTVLVPALGEPVDSRRAVLEISQLEALPVAILNRVIRRTALEVFSVSLSAAHTTSITRLITHWHGQGEAHVPGIRVERQGTQLVMSSTSSPPTESSAHQH
ncbi:tRNA lysidine(34) synthetase TilS [Aurantimicrobium minutum]|uniref:tRNA(Ile)-lysidine synthase n=1 Tax=Aurantimicrobium minutum TaxID=708131 RepID=A0A173LY63_9MICO|nr:tRNA lysidine(34) synthetase TilS [Aurantimicrobium minutum]BAU99813.1 tRNA(Ile)-lysidine synthetase [Aurantimicrobium minutum]